MPEPLSGLVEQRVRRATAGVSVFTTCDLAARARHRALRTRARRRAARVGVAAMALAAGMAGAFLYVPAIERAMSGLPSSTTALATTTSATASVVPRTASGFAGEAALQLRYPSTPGLYPSRRPVGATGPQALRGQARTGRR